MFYPHAVNSEYAEYGLCSMQMPIGWNGLSMTTEGCSVHMPIVIINVKVCFVK